MTGITRLLWRVALWSDESGQDMVEYALLASLVAVGSGLFAPSISENMLEFPPRGRQYPLFRRCKGQDCTAPLPRMVPLPSPVLWVAHV